MHQLRTEGVLNDLTKIEALPSVARGYVITDAGWNLLDFAAPLHALTSGSLLFRTLPIHGQDVDLRAVEQVGGEEVQRPHRPGLGPQEFGPARAVPARCRADASILEDLPDR